MSDIIELNSECIGDTKHKVFLTLYINPQFSGARMGNVLCLYGAEFSPGWKDAEFIEDREDRFDVWNTEYFAVTDLKLAMQAFDVRMGNGGFAPSNMGGTVEDILGSDDVPHTYHVISSDPAMNRQIMVPEDCNGPEAKRQVGDILKKSEARFKIIDRG